MRGMTERSGMSRIGMGLAIATLSVSGGLTVWAQAPAAAPGMMPEAGQGGGPGSGPGGMPGMGPHRPPMERAMGMHGDFGRWWNNQRAIDKFKLSDSQRKSMDDIYQQHRMTLVDLHATLEKAELAMEPMMREEQQDEGKILSQIDRVAQARAELEKANARMLFELRKQLTPEQWKQMEAERAAHHDHGAGGPEGAARWREHGGPGGPPPAGTGNGPGSGSGQATPNEPGPSGPGEER